MSRRWGPALLFCAAFLVTFLVALHTGHGLRVDAELHQRLTGTPLVRTQAVGSRALRTIDVSSVGLALLAITSVAVARRRFARAVAAFALVFVSVASVELLKHGLPRIGAVPAGRAPTFPSGHASIAVSLGIALVLVVGPTLRTVAALGAAAYAAGIGLALIVLSWHYPSDVVGAYAVCGFWGCVAAAAVGARPSTRPFTGTGAVGAVVAAAAALAGAAYLATRHPVVVGALRSRSVLLATAAALGALSIATFALIAAVCEEPDYSAGPRPSST